MLLTQIYDSCISQTVNVILTAERVEEFDKSASFVLHGFVELIVKLMVGAC